MMRLLTTFTLSLMLAMSAVNTFPLRASAQQSTTQTPPQTAQTQPGVGDSIMRESQRSAAARAGNNSASEGKPMWYESMSFSGVFAGVMTYIMMLFAWLLGVAMIMLDNTIFYTVVNMGSYIQNLSAIGVTWEILRNIGNILLIFGFLAIGISTILNVSWYGGKQMIVRLIMGAVLINFSLFMTEAMIDVGNFLATRVYTQINGGVSAGTRLSAGSADGVVSGVAALAAAAPTAVSNETVSSKIMNQLGLQRLYGDALDGNKDLLKENNIPLVAFLGILLFIILAFVMFFLSFILIVRFVYLLYAIIIAPVGIVGYVMPQFKSFGENWLHNLFTQSMTAPVMLLLLYVALRIITDASFLGFGAPPDYTGFIANRSGGYNLAGFANILISFFVAIGALLGVVWGTKKFGAVGASWASRSAGKVTGALSFGAMSLAGRGVFGSAGYLLNSKSMQARAAKGGVLGNLSKAGAFVGRNLENRTFDARNIPGVRSTMKGADSFAGGTGFGGAFEGGAKATTAKVALDKAFEGANYIKPFSGEWWKSQTRAYEKSETAKKREETLKNPASPDFVKTLQKMSEDELAELKEIRKGIKEYVSALSPANYNGLMKGEKLLKPEKDNLKNSWAKQFDTKYTKADEISKKIKEMSANDVASLDASVLVPEKDGKFKPNQEVVKALHPKHLDAIRNKNLLTEEQRSAIFEILSSDPQTAGMFTQYLDQDNKRVRYWNVNK